MTKESADFYKDAGETFIETASGIHFYLSKPEFSTYDIAHALSMIGRYNGHAREFYSVAEHSLLVSALVYHMGGTVQNCLDGLLHDATEAYLSDVPAPFKQFLPDWRGIDKELEFKFRIWADLPETKAEIIKEADWIALFIEAYWLLPDKGECFVGPPDLQKRALAIADNCPLLLAPPGNLRETFLSVWKDLKAGTGYDHQGYVRKPL